LHLQWPVDSPRQQASEFNPDPVRVEDVIDDLSMSIDRFGNQTCPHFLNRLPDQFQKLTGRTNPDIAAVTFDAKDLGDFQNCSESRV